MPEPARPARRTRAELREMMVNAGKAVLLQMPPTMGFHELTYARVFEQVLETYGQKVTTGSVHERIWQSQRDFQLDVLAEVLRETPKRLFDNASTGAIEAFTQADLTTPAGRRYAAQNITRLLQNDSWELESELNAHETIALAVRFRLSALDPDDPEATTFIKLVLDQRQYSSELYTNMITSLMEALGLRFRPGFETSGSEMLSVLGNAMTTGLITDVMPAAAEPKMLPTGPDGELEEWQPSALGLWFIVRSIVELDDDSLSEAERRL